MFGIDIFANVIGNIITDIPKQDMFRLLQAASIQMEELLERQKRIELLLEDIKRKL